MGVVLLPNRGRQDTAFLFYRPILRCLGIPGPEGTLLRPRERKDVARAIARVLVHEVIHAVAPDLSHASEGVMHDALLGAALSKERIEIDDVTRAVLLRRLSSE